MNEGMRGVQEEEASELVAEDDVGLEPAASGVNTHAILPVGAHAICAHFEQYSVGRVDAHSLVAHDVVVGEDAAGAARGLDA